MTSVALAAAGLVLVPALGAGAAPAALPHASAQQSSSTSTKVVAPRRAYLVGRRLVTPSGGSFTVPFAQAQADNLTLLGHSPAGFIIEREGNQQGVTSLRLFAVKRVGAKVVRRLIDSVRYGYQDGPWYASYRLSRDGTRIALSRRSYNAGQTSIEVLSSFGERIATAPRSEGRVVDFSGRRLVYQDYDPDTRQSIVQDWRVGSDPAAITTGIAVAADIAHGLLFLSDQSDEPRVDVVTFEDPDKVLWAGFDANWEVSPTGTYAAQALIADEHGPVQVHRAADGSDIPLANNSPSTYSFAWESADAYLVVTRGRIVRCRVVTHTCAPATKRLTGRISLAGTHLSFE